MVWIVSSTRPLDCGLSVLDMSCWKSYSLTNILNSLTLNSGQFSLMTVCGMPNFANIRLRCMITMEGCLSESECRKTWWYNQQWSYRILMEFRDGFVNFSPWYNFKDFIGSHAQAIHFSMPWCFEWMRFQTSLCRSVGTIILFPSRSIPFCLEVLSLLL